MKTNAIRGAPTPGKKKRIAERGKWVGIVRAGAIDYLCTSSKTYAMERTELEDLGEFGLIKRLTKDVKTRHESTLMGIGDDAAVIACGENRVALLTTDMLVEGIHFDLSYAPLKHLGYKAAVSNFSDIYAMNGRPKQMTVAIGLSNRFSYEAVEELYAGLLHAAAIYDVDLVGGDTVSTRGGLVISITVRGEAEREKVVYRSGAKANDIIVVSGDLGGAYMGLQVLEREKKVFQSAPQVQPDLEGYDYILERQLKPEARKDVVDMFEALGLKPTAMIDVSDGLASDLLHLCDRSQLGCSLYEDKIPLDPTVITTATDFHLSPTVCALSGGEDYELLFTISPGDYDKVKGSPHFTAIGHMNEGGGSNLIARDGSAHALTAQGWDAFLKGGFDERGGD